MKKLSFVALIIFSLFFIPACGKISKPLGEDYIALCTSAGQTSITMTVEYSFSQERFNARNKEEVLIFKENFMQNIETIRNEFLFSIALRYTENPIEEFALNRGVVLSGVTYKKDNVVSFSICYNSYASWNYYNNRSEGKSENNSTFFLKKIESEGVFPFAQKLTSGKLVGEKYKGIYVDALKGLTFEKEEKKQYNPSYVYDYATFSGGLKSNCDSESYSNGLYHNLWIKSESEYQTASIKLWQYSVNYGMWYLLALVGTLVPCMIIVAIKLKKEKKLKLTFDDKNRL